MKEETKLDSTSLWQSYFLRDLGLLMSRKDSTESPTRCGSYVSIAQMRVLTYLQFEMAVRSERNG